MVNNLDWNIVYLSIIFVKYLAFLKDFKFFTRQNHWFYDIEIGYHDIYITFVKNV